MECPDFVSLEFLSDKKLSYLQKLLIILFVATNIPNIPTNKQLGRLLDCNETTISRALSGLVRLGYIEISYDYENQIDNIRTLTSINFYSLQ